MALIRTVQTVFRISSFVLRSTLGGAAVATLAAALMLNRKRRTKTEGSKKRGR